MISITFSIGSNIDLEYEIFTFFLAKSLDLYLYFNIYSHVVIINKIDTEIEKMTLIYKILAATPLEVSRGT